MEHVATNGIVTAPKTQKKDGEESRVSFNSFGFRDFNLKPEILRAITDCGLEHRTEVQDTFILQAVLGKDILGGTESATRKTSMIVLATAQQLEPVAGQVSVLVLCHTKDLAIQISQDYAKFCKYMPDVKVAVFVGGLSISEDKAAVKNNAPHVVVGTPGGIWTLVRDKYLNLRHLKHLILDDCAEIFERFYMWREVQEIFRNTPDQKQVMMFSATLSEQIRLICKKFMKNPIEVYIDDEAKRTLQQHYINLKNNEKNGKLYRLLNVLEFNQVAIFVKSVLRCVILTQLLIERNFSAIAVHEDMSQEERLQCYQQFRHSQKGILISTDLFDCGMNIERVNIVFNYDMPQNSETYRHRVATVGGFGTKLKEDKLYTFSTWTTLNVN